MNKEKLITILVVIGVIMIGIVIVFTLKVKQIPPLGSDRDKHGCIGSAGYSWCDAKQKCLRIWEESCE